MRKFWLDCSFATALVFLIKWGVSGITQLNVFNSFDSIGQALSDVDLTDYVFSKLRDEPLVDSGHCDRKYWRPIKSRDRAGNKIISKYKPKVIGIDSFFGCPTLSRDTADCPKLADVMGNLLLSNAIQEAGNVVLVTKILQRDTALAADQYDSIRTSDAMFSEFSIRQGYANLETDAEFQDDAKTCRVVRTQAGSKW
jgi:hypothetical protein